MNFADRLPLLPLVLAFLVYPPLALAVLRGFPQRHKMKAFALLNIAGVACIAALSAAKNVRHNLVAQYGRAISIFLCIYVASVLLNYVFLRLSRRDRQPYTALAFFAPILILIAVKYTPASVNPFAGLLSHLSGKQMSEFFVGISYLSFRLSHLVQEVRNEVVEMPDIWQYLAFAFFVPTLSIGPINPYSKFIGSFSDSAQKLPVSRSLLRILVGLTKYLFLASLLNQFTYAGLLFDGHPHRVLDLVVAVYAYLFYLYCNFSGFCDIVIGVSGLLGIEVAENFNRPFSARNMQEYWNRWHMTLSGWLRDMMFTPATKSLIRRFGPKYANGIIAGTICLVFLLSGIWHGKGINFALWGLSQGVGLACVHYYGVFLKRRLGREGYAAYMSNAWIRYAAIAVTISYSAVTLFLFANNVTQMARILHLAFVG